MSLGRAAQRGEHQRQHGDAEIEILAKGAAVHQAAQIAVRGGDQTNVDGAVVALAEALHGARFEHAQQLGLHGERQLADLVEEDRSARSGLERAGPRPHRAGEGAPRMPEQLPLDERAGQRRAVDDDERLRGALRGRVDGARRQLLAGPRLAEQQDRRVALGHLGQPGVELAHRRARADEPPEAVAWPKRRRVTGRSGSGARSSVPPRRRRAPSGKRAAVTCSSPTKVPLRLPRSRTQVPFSVGSSSACSRETSRSETRTSAPGADPTVARPTITCVCAPASSVQRSSGRLRRQGVTRPRLISVSSPYSPADTRGVFPLRRAQRKGLVWRMS